MLWSAVRAAGGLVLLTVTPMLRARGMDPEEVARRWGLRVVPHPGGDLRRPHDLAG